VQLLRGGAVLALGVFVALLGQAPVQADSGRLRVDVPGGAISIEKLAPGLGGTSTVRVTNGSDSPAELSLQVLDLEDDENGCLRQETRDGDVTCDSSGGELSAWLRVRVARGDEQLWEGPITELGDRVVLDDDVAAGETQSLHLTVALPIEAGNDTMTDRVDFDLRWDARANGDSTSEILGVEAFAPGAGSGGGLPNVTLPFTGATVQPWLLWFAGVLIGGGGMLLAASRRLGRTSAF
jgi:hypothetical protein